MALVGIVEERTVTDPAAAGRVIEVIVVRDGFGADVAVGRLDTDGEITGMARTIGECCSGYSGSCCSQFL